MSGEPFKSGLLDILVCPATRQPLRLDASGTALISDAAGLAYPIRDGIPVLVIDEAVPVSELPA
jgi:uncharacterized protein YbaR (Trm112 family)